MSLHGNVPDLGFIWFLQVQIQDLRRLQRNIDSEPDSVHIDATVHGYQPQGEMIGFLKDSANQKVCLNFFLVEDNADVNRVQSNFNYIFSFFI